MNTPLFTRSVYVFLFSLLGLVYIAGLFVPLMDNDSAHHAVIALRMYLTGDYATLIDHDGDYLDKPHFLFWTSALSYHLFGVNTFAYKFPSFLFTVLGTYWIFRLVKELYEPDTGRLAALVAATSFCYILANNDVRMDAILAAAMALAGWQGVAYVHHRKYISLIGASLGMAIGFATKGHIGLVIPAAGIFFYILYKKEWRLLYDWRWLLLIFFFTLFIFPVVYCYYLQFNLHPEKTVHGSTGVNGVKYILWGHSFDRFFGDHRFGTSPASGDPFYFFHTFLWTYAPWSLVAYAALFSRVKNFFRRKGEWFSTGTFILLALLFSFSDFKLPHYMPVLAPATSLMVAVYFMQRRGSGTWRKLFFILQLLVILILLLITAAVNSWIFPVKSSWVVVIMILLLSLVFYFFLSNKYSPVQKSILVPASAVILLFFSLNTNFYPRLLTYQGGKPLAEVTRNVADPERAYFWPATFSSSYNFYTATLRRVYHDSLRNSGKNFWLIYEKSQQAQVDAAGIIQGKSFSVPDYEITRMKMNFVNPATRNEALDSMVMTEVKGWKMND